MDLAAPELYINRELSLLEFNQRVLTLARDPDVPLLERMRFLCIASSNLDEFFEIRVAGLKQLEELGSSAPAPDGRSLREQLVAVHERCSRLVADQYDCLDRVLMPELKAADVTLLSRPEWDAETDAWLLSYFETEIEPVLSPLGLDPARPFPRIQNKSLNFIVELRGQDAFGRDSELAIVQAPRSLPRVVPVGGPHSRTLVLLSAIVQAYVRRLFPGIEVLGCHQFRLTRNSDLFVDEEEIDDLRRALEGELAQRRYGAAVRLETSTDCPSSTTQFLLKQFSLHEHDLYPVPGPVNLNRLSAIYDLVQRPELKYPPFIPSLSRQIAAAPDLFAAIRQGEILLHHPFQSFVPVMDFVRRAAADPQVLAIKQTLYRTGSESPVVDALVAAAQAGKDVTVIVELRARFDEEANIELSNRLQEAGAHVMYGVVGYKTHAKMILVVRREAGHIRRYCHLGTGNYHPRTARDYTDYGLFTCDEEIGHDIHELFLQLTSLTQTPKLKQVVQSPFGLHAFVLEKIARESAHARAGRPGRIIAKMNALIDPEAIRALYEASQAGVQIDLIVRGVCALRPGLPGVSDNIRVRSILGRFLEHTRAFYFGNGSDSGDNSVNGGDKVSADGGDAASKEAAGSELYCSSADWMPRNFFRRVELAFPIRDPGQRACILRDLDAYLSDTTQAWVLASDGTYTRLTPGEGTARNAQRELLESYAGGVG